MAGFVKSVAEYICNNTPDNSFGFTVHKEVASLQFGKHSFPSRGGQSANKSNHNLGIEFANLGNRDFHSKDCCRRPTRDEVVSRKNQHTRWRTHQKLTK
jgi:hypothetical protein